MSAEARALVPAQAGIRRRRIGVLGAPGSGRTWLAGELAAPAARADLTVVELASAAEASEGDALLLMGLDLPSAAGREADDARIRAQLQAAGRVFQVVYGQGPQRLHGALQALEAAGVLPAGSAPRAPEPARRPWLAACEKCSDPECEHRLFTRLREAR